MHPTHAPRSYVSLSVESLEFLEILRLLKFEDIITMVRSHVGSATPPSVMVLFSLQSVFQLWEVVIGEENQIIVILNEDSSLSS